MNKKVSRRGAEKERPLPISSASPREKRVWRMVAAKDLLTRPQVKICGVTRPDEAVACAELGADAIGCIFYPRSPRHVNEEQARTVFRSLPASVCRVGVFVNEMFDTIVQKVERCQLSAVQLHGQESPELVGQLRQAGIIVIKAIFVNGTPSLERIGSFRASAYLVECAGGALPGGNALTWDWSAAAGVSPREPLILAGGLDPDNISRAIGEALPDAVDVSSGVEVSPGRKDISKVKRLLEAVARTDLPRKPRRIFR